jgi:hypothetical protein
MPDAIAEAAASQSRPSRTDDTSELADAELERAADEALGRFKAVMRAAIREHLAEGSSPDELRAELADGIDGLALDCFGLAADDDRLPRFREWISELFDRELGQALAAREPMPC